MGLFDANNVKCAEVRKLVEEQQYKKALEVLEKININKVKSMADLNVFAHVYQKAKKYEEARDILYRIYEKRPNRRVIYKLVYLAILVSDFEEAEELYEEYVEFEEKTAEQYILRYGLDKAEGKDYAVRIQSLLKIKELDYTEEWAYELAKTYHKAGMAQACVDECSDIILWFGEGKIVEKATLLRAYYVDGVEVLQSYGITLNEQGEYYYDERAAQEYYRATHPITSAGEDTQNLSAQISYITEQKRQAAIHNELTKDLEKTMDIQQAIMQERGNLAFQEELQHMIGGNSDREEMRHQEWITRDMQAQEVEKIHQLEAEQKEFFEENQEIYEEYPEQIFSQEEKDLKIDQKAIEPNGIKLKNELKKESLNSSFSEIEENKITEKEEDEYLEENQEKTKKAEKVKRTKSFSLFSKNRKKKQKNDNQESRLVQLPREEARIMIEQEDQIRQEEQLKQEILKKEKEAKKIEEALKMKAEFSDDISNTKNLFEKLRGKTIKAKEKSAAIEKEQNILASLTEKPPMRKEWNGSIEVPDVVPDKKEQTEKVKTLSKEEWLEKTKKVSREVEEAKKEASVIGDTISIKIKPKDTKIVIDGIDVTKNFGSYAEQPKVRAQLLKELTRMREGEKPLHIALSGKDNEQTMDFVKNLGKTIKEIEVLQSHRIASIDAEKLNKIQLADKQGELKNGCVAIKNAGKITADTAQSLINMIEEFQEEVIVILIDQYSSLDFLMTEYPALARYFKYNLAI